MSTTINVTVDDGGLPAKNRQQTAANRQAFVQGRASQQAAQQGADQRAADRRAAGLDPATGRPTGAPSRLPRIKEEPAANRSGERFIQVFPPTALLPTSPLPADVQPDYQASIRQWWQLQQRGMVQQVGFGNVQQAESNYFKNPAIYSSGNYVTIDPTTLNTTEPVLGTQLESTTTSRLVSSLFSPAGREPSEVVLSGTLQTPPLCNDLIVGSVRTNAVARLDIILAAANPSFILAINVVVDGQNIQPISVLNAQGGITSISIEPSSLLTYRIRKGPSGISTVTINDQTVITSNQSIWSPGQSFSLTCAFLCQLERDALVSQGLNVPWASVPESAGLIGTTRVSFK